MTWSLHMSAYRCIALKKLQFLDFSHSAAFSIPAEIYIQHTLHSVFRAFCMQHFGHLGILACSAFWVFDMLGIPASSNPDYSQIILCSLYEVQDTRCRLTSVVSVVISLDTTVIVIACNYCAVLLMWWFLVKWRLNPYVLKWPLINCR